VSVAQAPSALASELGRIVGTEHATATVPAEERASTIRAFLARIAAARPLVLVVDDLHHAEQALFDVLLHVVEWSRDAPILLLCLGRPELFFDHPSWGRLPGRLTLHLEPLGDEDGAGLVRELLPGAAKEVEQRIVEIAGGNPFFIEEVTTSLDGPAEALAPVDVPVPPTVTALLEARVDRIPDDERRVLERAAVLGLTFREAELTSIAGGEAAAMLGRLADRDLVLPDPAVVPGGWRFRHALIRDTAYGVIPKQLRAELHTAVAEFSRTRPINEEVWATFAKSIDYVATPDDSSYDDLRDALARIDGEIGANGNRLFYLATPPAAYEPIIRAIGAHGLRGESGWSRVVVEKPYGRDLKSAMALTGVVQEVFREDEVFRIDHYLGKETVQNILVLRFANSIFEPIWTRQYVDHVQITAAESLGI